MHTRVHTHIKTFYELCSGGKHFKGVTTQRAIATAMKKKTKRIEKIISEVAEADTTAVFIPTHGDIIVSHKIRKDDEKRYISRSYCYKVKCAEAGLIHVLFAL